MIMRFTLAGHVMLISLCLLCLPRSLNGGIQGPYEAQAYITHPGPYLLTPEAAAPEGAAPAQPGTDSTAQAHSTGNGSAGSGSAASAQEPATQQPQEGQQQEGQDTERCGSHSHAGHSGWIEGVMIGRQAYNDPWGVLADADRAVFGEPCNPATSRRQVRQALLRLGSPPCTTSWGALAANLH